MTDHAPSGRSMAAVWLCAITLSIGFMAGLLRFCERPDLESRWIESPPFGLVIGTSLIRQAFPPEIAATVLFSEAGSVDRIARAASPALSDTESIKLLQRAIDLGIRKIFLEIDPLLRSFGSDQIPDHLRPLRDFSNRLRAATLKLLSPKPAATDDAAFDPIFYTRAYDGNTNDLAKYDPVAVHPPRDPASIARALAAARRQGIDVVWIAMPRSETAVNYFGPTIEAAFAKQLQEFAEKLDARVWRPARFWPNEFFLDQGHFNAAGRARILSEFRLYLAAAR